jgi:hypothetical protein
VREFAKKFFEKVFKCRAIIFAFFNTFAIALAITENRSELQCFSPSLSYFSKQLHTFRKKERAVSS